MVAIELDGDNDHVRLCRDQGALTLVGSAVDEAMLRRARVPRAKSIVAISGDEGLNVEIILAAHRVMRAEKKRRQETVTGFVHIIDQKLCALFKEHLVFTDRNDRLEVRVFNIHESSARFLFEEHPLDWQPIPPADTRAVHLICVGFGRTGEAVILQAARIGHLANGRRPRVTVIDLEAERKAGGFCGRYPRFTEICETAFLPGDIADIAILREVRRIAHDPSVLPTLAICMNDDAKNLLTAMHLQEFVGEERMQICARMMEVTGLTSLLAPAGEAAGRAAVIHPFGMGSRVCTYRMLFDRQQDALAEAIHEWTRRQRPGTDGAGEMPASPPWSQLATVRQDAFRQQADHTPIKLRAVGCRLAPRDACPNPVTGFADQETDIMARMEHSRERAADLLGPWARGDAAGDSRSGPALAAWEDLPDGDRSRRRAFVRALPDLLGAAGLAVCRTADGPAKSGLP